MPSPRPTESPLSRRQFLGSSAANAAGVAAGVASGVVPWMEEALAGEVSPSDVVRVGVIGVRNQGRLIAGELPRIPGVQVTGLCDVDGSLLPAVARQVAELQNGKAPRLERDFRSLLDDPAIDAVVIATPDHWHALMAALAMQAGKDVYLESPVTHTIDEGIRLADIARQLGRIVQGGLQQRSGRHFQQAIEYVRGGALGRVHLARAWTVHQKKTIGVKADGVAPPDVDYDQWLGPAPVRPFQPNRFHHNWRWFWEYGSGELGNWGVQMLDAARWGMGVDSPVQVSASGGKYHFQDDQQTPDTLSVSFSFPDTTILWEHRLWSNHAPEGRSSAAAFHGERGTLIVDRGGWKVYGGPEASGVGSGDLLVPHLKNFIDCVRSRSEPVAGLAVSQPSSALCHLGNIAYRLGTTVNVDPLTGRPRNDTSANRLAEMTYRAPWHWPS
ncbi:MAG: Gfo/Idh/MocA family oxidoreductase [Planctomycetota bacterium]|nr:Gfo/Idh/MocA family oxidoreductase [Planctomycetota bacterium]